MKELKFLSLVMVAVAALLLTACTSESESSPSGNISYESIKAAEQVPVTFGTYIGDNAITRAGTPGSISNAEDLVTNGNFGVFAYYTAGANYSASATPNFMYNQLVEGTEITVPAPTVPKSYTWSYSPVKYWPNDFVNGPVDNQDNDASDNEATGSQASAVSFFAYAPRVAVTQNAYDNTQEAAATGTSGIMSLTGNGATGDPKVKYTFDRTGLNSVDLMWGVAGTSDVNVLGTANHTDDDGLPFLNQTKQKTGGEISFNFKHALARLGLTVRAARDQEPAGPDAGPELWVNGDAANQTKIFIEYVKLTGKFPTQGILNLNNTVANKPEWESLVGATSNLDITINTANANLETSLRYASSNSLAAADPAGVLVKSPKPLLEGGEDEYFMFIPNTANQTDVTVEIKYHVMTADANLSGGKSDITNTITKTVSGLSFDYGKSYTMELVLGMTSVKIAATVVDWSDQGSTPVYLPINVD
jgi:hypothetical protein